MKKKNQGLHPLPTPPGLKAISYIKIVTKRWTNWKNARNSQKILGVPSIKSIITYKTSFRKRDSFQYGTCTFWTPSLFIDCHYLYYAQFWSIFRFFHESVRIFCVIYYQLSSFTVTVLTVLKMCILAIFKENP